FGMVVGALTFGVLVGTLTFGMLVGTFTAPALARSAPTTTAQRATETLTSFVALILSLPGLGVAVLVKCYQCYALLMLLPRGMKMVVPLSNSLSSRGCLSVYEIVHTAT